MASLSPQGDGEGGHFLPPFGTSQRIDLHMGHCFGFSVLGCQAYPQRRHLQVFISGLLIDFYPFSIFPANDKGIVPLRRADIPTTSRIFVVSEKLCLAFFRRFGAPMLVPAGEIGGGGIIHHGALANRYAVKFMLLHDHSPLVFVFGVIPVLLALIYIIIIIMSRKMITNRINMLREKVKINEKRGEII